MISQVFGVWIGDETSVSELDRKYDFYPDIFDTLFSWIFIFFKLILIQPVDIFFKKDR